MQAGENNRRVHMDVSLPEVNSSVFCKRWHLGNHYFTECPRVGSHVPLPNDVVDIWWGEAHVADNIVVAGE